MSCCAPGCKTGYGTKGTYPPGVGGHHIPKKPDIRQKWMEAIPRANWKPTKHTRICSLVSWRQSGKCIRVYYALYVKLVASASGVRVLKPTSLESKVDIIAAQN